MAIALPTNWLSYGHTGKLGLFLILIGKAQAPVWEATGKHHLEWKKPMPYLNHYSFHTWDREWGTHHHQDLRASILSGASHLERS